MFAPSLKTPQDCLERANACERLANTSASQEVRDTMLDLARRWRQFAEEAGAKAVRPSRIRPQHPSE
jgi:hypothetical protein